MIDRVVITGAGGALGRSVVERFVAARNQVVAVDADASALEGLKESSSWTGLSTQVRDLTDSEQVRSLFDSLRASESGEVLGIVHLVGGFRFAPLKSLTDLDWRYLIDLNLETTVRVVRESAVMFEELGGGSLVAVSSPAAITAAAGMGPYGAVKAGVLSLVQALAREVAPFGARANAVVPGTMDTLANRAAMPDTDAATWVSTAAVADVVYFLTSPAASGINGAAVDVPGPTLA